MQSIDRQIAAPLPAEGRLPLAGIGRPAGVVKPAVDRRPRPQGRTATRYVPLAALSGALMAVSYQPLGWWPMVFVGVGLFTWVIRHSAASARHPGWRSFGLGYLMGLGLFGLLVAWITVLGLWIGLALIAFMALWGGVAGLGTMLVRRAPGWPIWTAAVWSLVEFGSTRVPFGGFGWARLGVTTVDQPLAHFLPIISLAGVSFLVALIATSLTWLVEQAAALRMVRDGGDAAERGAGRVSPLVRMAAVAGALAVMIAGGGVLARYPWAASIAPSGWGSDSINIGVVQGDIPGPNGIQPNYLAGSTTTNTLSETIMLMAMARTATTPVPDLVLWPENSTDSDPYSDEWTTGVITDAVQLTEVPILVGAITKPRVGERQTTAVWWDPNRGPVARYDKRNLVPFGEYIPLRDQLLPLFPILAEVGSQGVPGSEPGVLDVTLADGRQVSIGDIICFELAYDQTVRDTVAHGGQVIVVQSNNATYTGTNQTSQQFALTRVRAMELHRYITVATTNSLSGSIGPDGTVLAQATEHRPWAGTFTVPLDTHLTPAARWGAGIEYALVGLAALGLLIATAQRRHRAAG